MSDLHLVEQGAGSPVLLLPGLTFPAATWAPVRDHAQDGGHWLAVDLPGHGRSAPWDVVTPVEVADRLADQVARRGLQPPVVVGHSYGALVAAAYAGRHPVHALVTVDQRVDLGGLPVPPGGLPAGGAERAAPRLVAAVQASVQAEALPARSAAQLAAVHAPRPDVVVPYLRPLEGTGAASLLAPVLAAAREVRVPWVDVHRDEPGAAHRGQVAAGRPEVQVWGGRSHCVHLEQPSRLAQLVTALRQREHVRA